MIRDPRKVKQNLLRKGFIEVQKTRHIYYIFVYEGKRQSIQTFMSRNDQDLYDNLLSDMKNQLKLDKTRDFLGLIDCPLSEEDYIKILLSKNLIEESEEE